MTESRQLVVVGAGISGTAAAIEAARAGVRVTLIDENPVPTSLVGLNIPQFYGQRFSDALLDEAEMVQATVSSNEALAEAEEVGVDIQLGTCVWGAFRNSENSRNLDGPQIGLSDYKRSWMMRYQCLIVATGARDLSIGFRGWERAGTMGANGAYSLVNRYKALRSKRMVVLGSGDLGLNTAKMAMGYGAEVAAVVDVSPTMQGDAVLAAALKDRGVVFYTSHTISEAKGEDGEIQSVALVEIDKDAEPIAGSEKHISADTICLAIGLAPNVELLNLLDCDLDFRSDLGGHVPAHDDWMCTSVGNVFVAGDVAGFHDAMILDPEIARNQGRLAGIAAAASLGAIDEAARGRSQVRDSAQLP